MKLLFSGTLVLLTCFVKIHASPVHFNSVESNSNLHNRLDAIVTCPQGYTQPDNSGWSMCYKIFTDFKSRNDAFDECRHDNASLASIPNAFALCRAKTVISKREQTVETVVIKWSNTSIGPLIDKANSYIYSLAKDVGTTAIWLGFHCFTSDPSSCVNDDQTIFSYNNFYPGQPTTIDICVYMSALGKDNQKWLSHSCDRTYQFACEVPAIVELPPTTTTLPTTTVKPRTTTQTTTTTTTTIIPTTSTAIPTTTLKPTTIQTTTKKLKCPKNYKKFQGMCYALMLADNSQSRSQQKAACRKVPGGNLATIPNSDVNDFLGTLGCEQTEIRFGLTCPNVKHSGDMSSCKWDDGTKFKYNAFANGDPNEEDVGDCPYYSEGVWYDNIDCDSGLYCSACQAPLQ